jgi:hypothetical protein
MFFIALMTTGFIAAGQRGNHSGIIPSVFFRGNITDRFDYNVFASTTYLPFRSGIKGSEYVRKNSELYIQPGLVYKYSSELNFAVGYTYIRSNSFTPIIETEQQIWQQIIFEHAAFKGLMLHRIRLIEDLKREHPTAFNYQIAFEKPLEGRVLDEGEFYFTCFNETFLNLSSNSGIYSNWTFAGLGFKTFKAGKLEVGPLIQTAFNVGKRNDTLYLLQVLWLFDSKLFRR